MSVKVMTWVWEHSPVAGNERLVLLAIADNADDTGSNAWPSTKTLAHKTRLDVRTVQRVVRRLCDGGHLMVATAAGKGGANLYRVVMDPSHHTTHPVDNPVDKAVDSGGDPRQDATPADCHPRHQRHHPPGTSAGGPPAQLCHPNVLNVLEPPPPPRARACPPDGQPDQAAAKQPATEGNHPADAEPAPEGASYAVVARRLLGELPAPWGPLGRGQRRQLVPLVVAALRGDHGRAWPPAALAEHLAGGNATGVRAPYAVLRARLRDLPDPPATPVAVARPAHCGGCYEPTRQREDDHGRPYPCPACHPDATRRAAGAQVEARTHTTTGHAA